MTTSGARFGLKLPSLKELSDEDGGSDGTRKKKFGFPLCAPSEMDLATCPGSTCGVVGARRSLSHAATAAKANMASDEKRFMGSLLVGAAGVGKGESV